MAKRRSMKKRTMKRTMKRRRNVRKMKQHGGSGFTDFFGNITNKIGSIIGNKSNQPREELDEIVERDITIKPRQEYNNSNQVVPMSYGGKLRRTRKRH